MPHRLARSASGICRKLGVAFVFFGVIAACGCYHVRVIVPQPDPGTEYNKKKTVQNLAWGMLPKKTRDIPAKNCLNSTGLDEVRVSSNLGYSFLTVGTLGFWSPAQIEWRCTKQHLAPSNPIHKKKPVSLTFASPQADSPRLSGKETIHTIAWGLVAKNAVSKCVDSRSMDEVRVSSNLGYHFLTLATLGFWSPTNVEWTCSRLQQQSGMLNPNSLLQNQAGLESR